VKVGEPLKLDIGISGSPTPTVTWLKDGNPIVGVSKNRINSFEMNEVSLFLHQVFNLYCL
jgi:hypothetical protein